MGELAVRDEALQICLVPSGGTARVASPPGGECKLEFQPMAAVNGLIASFSSYHQPDIPRAMVWLCNSFLINQTKDQAAAGTENGRTKKSAGRDFCSFVKVGTCQVNACDSSETRLPFT